MDVLMTSLEALIQRITNPQNQLTDIAAIEAFSVMLKKERDGVSIAAKLLATHIQSSTEWEALQSLALLDACMKRCGPTFHAEIGKFRFLNEMIKLVSPKYLGNRTPPSVRQMVLKLLHSWTQNYPGEVKIKEAYEMLKKQGVLKDELLAISNETEDIKQPKCKHPIFEDDDRAKVLKQLLQSKNPNDLQSANKLIKTMVKEDERRVEQHSRRIMELESVHNNVRLLSDMLDSHNRSQASPDDLELLKELYQACERLRPNIFILANETQDNQEMLNEVLAANDELSQVFRKYMSVIALGDSPSQANNNSSNAASLLDLSATSETFSPGDNLSTNENNDINLLGKNRQSDLEMLGDIFSPLEIGDTTAASNPPSILPESNIMQPISIAPTVPKGNSTELTKFDSKAKALEELDTLGESLLKQSLTSLAVQRTQFSNTSKPTMRIPMNSMTKPVINMNENNQAKMNSLIGDSAPGNLLQLSRFESGVVKDRPSNSIMEMLNGDDSLVDITTNEIEVVKKNESSNKDTSKTLDVNLSPVHVEPEIKPLTDINVTLENIKPSTIPPLTVLEEKNEISVVLHFAKDKPRSDVSVIVVTTMSKNANPLSNYLFQAVVPKTCKCRLQPPSGTKLPGHNPFLPPSAITQIMLIANPTKDNISLKFMLSYTMEDETVTEMGEVDQLPNT